MIQIIIPLAQSFMQNDEDVRKLCDGQTGDTTKYNPNINVKATGHGVYHTSRTLWIMLVPLEDLSLYLDLLIALE